MSQGDIICKYKKNATMIKETGVHGWYEVYGDNNGMLC
jgi:hypothetical protein